MGNPLPTLIKLAKHQVEKTQIQVSEVRANMASIEADLADLEAQLVRGAEVAAAMNDAVVFGQAAAYVKMAKKKKEILTQRLAEWQGLLDKLLLKLNEHYAAQKRYETLHQRKEQAHKRAREARAQKGLDEAAGVAWQGAE